MVNKQGGKPAPKKKPQPKVEKKEAPKKESQGSEKKTIRISEEEFREKIYTKVQEILDEIENGSKLEYIKLAGLPPLYFRLGGGRDYDKYIYLSVKGDDNRFKTIAQMYSFLSQIGAPKTFMILLEIAKEEVEVFNALHKKKKSVVPINEGAKEILEELALDLED